ncbi:MAG: hypothetical protein HYS06_12705 [Methylocystis sp.]|nr:hypothetical protein [Methylocystis sp.]
MQPDPCLRVARPLWTEFTGELHRRTEGRHESGAFLLGRKVEDSRRTLSLVYYDELDPQAYDSGVCVLHADAFGRLWDHCADLGLTVVADAHVHGRGAGQSRSDRENPMIAHPGHLALILPLMARIPVRRWAIGIYEYLGDHQWRAHGGCKVARILKIEDEQ